MKIKTFSSLSGLIILCSFLIMNRTEAQNIAITDDESYTAESSAMLDVKSITKGLLIPRLDSVQRVGISSPATGLLVFDTDASAFYYYNGADWLNLTTNVISPASAGMNDALFSVINIAGDTVFAVYSEGVEINVGDGEAKANKGGFAVGGLASGKLPQTEFFRVTTDSVRIYIDTTTGTKANKGGFAVGGLASGKANGPEFLRVTPDSTRIYVNESPVKGASGGFAVGGINNQSKSSSGNFLDLTPLNSFIGLDAGKSNTTGERNAFIGYQAGLMNTEGYDNVFIGNTSGQGNTSGVRNIFIGTSSGEKNTTGFQNIAIGLQSGFSLETGRKNIFIGTVAGYSNVDGLDNVFIGNYAGWQSTGSSNVYIGRTTGMNNTSGIGNVFIGEQSGQSNVEGSGNVFIGKGAGQNELGSNRLYISNSNTIYPLIYGEFDNGLVEVNGSVKLTDILNLKPKTSFPGSPAEGDVFYDANSHSIKFFNGTEWMELSATASASMPLVTTDSIPGISILGESCVVYGNISDQGGSPIVESGICYSEIPFFDFELRYDSVHSTPGVGNFNVTVTGLNQYQDYYIRSFATNSEGTSMGEMIQITTGIAGALPSVESSAVLSITQTTAIGGGDVTLPGGTELTALGICWNTSPEPTIANNFTSESVALGTFTSNLSGLTAETTYYVRAYATNGNGTAYGDEVIFNTASDITTVSDIEGNVYNTVQIGTQTWMKENLKTTRYSDGSDIPNITDNTEWEVQTEGAFCWYDNDSTTYNETYGAMYNYYAVVDSRNLCPTGWHVPTDTDWTNLSDYLGGLNIAGGKLKETGTTHWESPNNGADNSSGFTALPGGWRYDEYGFQDIGYFGEWLSSTENSATRVWTYYLQNTSLLFRRFEDLKSGGYSVRCIKD